MTVRVVVADDHRVLRESLRRVLEERSGIEVVGEAADGHEAVEVCVAMRPSVVLMDVSMPGQDGLAATRELRSLLPDTRVVVLTMHDDVEVVEQARRVGAAGYLFKDTAVDEVVAAVERAASGALVLGHGVGGADRWIEDRVNAVAGSGDRPLLSEREAQILTLAAEGLTAAVIAERLVLSPKTVRNHLSRIYGKLEVGNRADAIVAGLRAGLIRLD